MTETYTSAPGAEPIGRSRLSFDLDVDICVVGAGLAGLTVALEAARLGASVAVLEARTVGWGASGHHVGTVMPGFALALPDLIERVGFDEARELWTLSREGAEFVRANATEELMPGIARSEGALEVSNVDAGDRLISRLQMLGEDFDTEVEGWQVDRVRATLRTDRYFHGVFYPRAFQVDSRSYVHGLAELARRAGARIFEDTPVVSIDASGIRKRIATPSARLRAGHVVLAGNVHLGATMQRLTDTLLPVWRYAGVTAPLGERLAEVIAFRGSVIDSDGIDHFRVLEGQRLLWAGPQTTWDQRPARLAGTIERRIRSVFPDLGPVEVTDVSSGATGETVHGMPQIGEIRQGLWVASGFGAQGMNTAAMAGQLIARGIVLGDDRWRLFLPFELVWAGGFTGRVAGQLISVWNRASSAAGGTLARYRERRAAGQSRERGRQAGHRRSAPSAGAAKPRLQTSDRPASEEA